jgi:branched-chain amino acid transport system permease protein
VTGLLIASLLALGAVGLSLTFGVARFANVAHPDFMMLGAYTTFAFNTLAGVPFGWAALLGVAGAVLVGVPVARIAYDRLPVTGTVQLLIISIGVSFILRHAVLFVFGSNLLQFAVPLQRPYVWGPVRLTPYQILTLVVAAVLVLAVHLLLSRTKLGRILRATADNPVLTEIAGADVARARLAMWVIAVLLASVGGILFGLNLVIQPNMGWDLVIPIFSAAILGGIGNPYGAMAGALVIGLVQEWSTLVIPAAYKEAIAFGAMALCLVFRPRGLWGGA